MQKSKPNILVFMVDQLTAFALKAFGSTNIGKSYHLTIGSRISFIDKAVPKLFDSTGVADLNIVASRVLKNHKTKLSFLSSSDQYNFGNNELEFLRLNWIHTSQGGGSLSHTVYSKGNLLRILLVYKDDQQAGSFQDGLSFDFKNSMLRFRTEYSVNSLLDIGLEANTYEISSNVQGSIELAEMVFEMPVRLGKPQQVENLPDIILFKDI